MTDQERKRCPDFARILAETPASSSVQEQIIRCFHAELQSAARRICRSDDMADDAVQMAFETGLESLGAFRGEAPIDAWLRTIVRSTCNRLKRTRKDDPHFTRPLEQISAAEEADQSVPSQDTQLLVLERLDILRHVIEDVPEPNRSLLLVHELEEVPLQDLAQQFGLSEESVKARLKRTRQFVRDRVLQAANEPV